MAATEFAGWPVVYGIANCDSVKKARAWLAAEGVEAVFHDVARAGLPPTRLDAWLESLGWEAVVNRRGTTWRKLAPAAQRAIVDRTSAARAILAQPSLFKRPIVEWPDGAITVGFDAAAWAARAGVGG